MEAFGDFCLAALILTGVGFFVRWRLRVNRARRASRTDEGGSLVDRPRDGGDSQRR